MIIDLASTEDLSGLLPLWEHEADGYRYVLYSGHKVAVYKGEAQTPTYTIDEHGCSCPASQYGSSCKHRAKFSWVGSGQSATKNTQQEPDNGINSLL